MLQDKRFAAAIIRINSNHRYHVSGSFYLFGRLIISFIMKKMYIIKTIIYSTSNGISLRVKFLKSMCLYKAKPNKNAIIAKTNLILSYRSFFNVLLVYQLMFRLQK